MAGLILDPWEEFVLRHSLGERADGKWAAFEVGACVPRQNGKGSILEARELAGLFLLDERLIIHSAHQFDTSLEAFRRLLMLIEDTPDLDRRVKRVSRSHGEEGIELMNRQRIRFRTRTKGGGRGFTGDCLILDEAMILPESAHGALLPTLSARPNPQVWYAGSAVDEDIHDDGIVFTRIRERGIKGDDPSLMYVEWSVAASSPDEISEGVATDPQAWAQSNPGLGIRITSEHIEREQRSMDTRTFAVERLGVGAWPPLDRVDASGIDPMVWLGLKDLTSFISGPPGLAFDVRPDRSMTSIGQAGNRDDGRRHIEVIDRRPGTGWVIPRLIELSEEHDGAPIICDGASPAAALVRSARDAGLVIETVGPKEYAEACGRFFDGVDQGTVRHLDTPELSSAIRGAAQRSCGDAWAWSRKASTVDISPLVACTLALWKVEEARPVHTGRAVIT